MKLLFFANKDKTNSNSLWNQIVRNKVYYIMLSPFLALFTVFMLIPVVSAIFLSFTNFNLVQIPNFVGLNNYIHLFLDDEVFIKALMNTFLFAVITGPVGFLASFIVAWLVNELGRVTQSFVTFIMYAPALTANAFFMWIFIFSGDSKGLLNSFLIKFGFIQNPVPWLSDSRYNLGVVIVVIIWLSLGVGFLALVAGFKSLDRGIYEAGSIDGVRNRWQELYYITLPQMGPQLLFSAIMSISGSFAVASVPMALTGFPSTDYATHTMLLHMQDFATIRFEMGYASSIAVVLFLIMLLSWVIINKVFSKFSD